MTCTEKIPGLSSFPKSFYTWFLVNHDSTSCFLRPDYRIKSCIAYNLWNKDSKVFPELKSYLIVKPAFCKKSLPYNNKGRRFMGSEKPMWIWLPGYPWCEGSNGCVHHFSPAHDLWSSQTRVSLLLLYSTRRELFSLEYSVSHSTQAAPYTLARRNRLLFAKRQRGVFRLHVGCANTQWFSGIFSPVPQGPG